MTSSAPPLRIFLDEGVPHSVGKVFKDAGHEVIYFAEAAVAGSPDQLVCAIAEANNAVLVALDGDMKEIAQGRGVGQHRYKKLSLIKISCRETRAAERLRGAMSLIEHEWNLSCDESGRRIFIEIGKRTIKTVR